jgi:hypothetical protein
VLCVGIVRIAGHSTNYTIIYTITKTLSNRNMALAGGNRGNRNRSSERNNNMKIFAASHPLPLSHTLITIIVIKTYCLLGNKYTEYINILVSTSYLNNR